MEHVIPVHMTAGLGTMQAPLFSIYYSGDTPDIAMPDTETLVLTQGAQSLTIDLVGKRTSDVVALISRSNLGYEARVMLDVDDVGVLEASFDPADVTLDGGFIIRGLGHAVRRLENTRIHLKAPYNEDRHFPWYVVVNKGWATRVWRGQLWKYGVPEYSEQTWSTFYGQGYIDMDDVPMIRTGPTTFMLPRAPIHWDRQNIIIKRRNSILPDSLIKDVDVHNGIVYLWRSIPDNEQLLATYTYREDGYIYTGIDLNPTEFHNPAILDRWIVFYALPYSGPDGVLRSACIQHAESSTLRGVLQSLPQTDEPLLILGAAQVRNVLDRDSQRVVDTRVHGGGVKDGMWSEAERRNREVLSATDIGFYDGRPFAGNMSLFVTVPKDLRELFREEEIRGIVGKFTEYGTYLFLEYE